MLRGIAPAGSTSLCTSLRRLHLIQKSCAHEGFAYNSPPPGGGLCVFRLSIVIVEEVGVGRQFSKH